MAEATVKLSFNEGVAGTNYSHRPGQVKDIGVDEAVRLVERNVADPFDDTAKKQIQQRAAELKDAKRDAIETGTAKKPAENAKIGK